MNYQALLESAQSLSAVERAMLISALTDFGDSISEKPPCPRLKELLNKQASCPHCGGKHYYRYGKDKGSQRFKCKECGKTFTEYTGTWQERLHKKELVDKYILMMSEEKSLDKISAALHINKKTAFDWRHKILDTLNQDEGDLFSGICKPLPSNTILCSDGHVSYKGYANDNHLKHVVLRADLK